MKKSVAKKTKKKKTVAAVEKLVRIFVGSVETAVEQANAEMKLRNPAWEARPIEFTSLQAGSLQITINFKKNGKGDGSQITWASLPASWMFTLTKNHPVLDIGGTVYYFGIV